MIWNQTTSEIAQALNTNSNEGLSEVQAAQLLHKSGPNQLPISKKKPIWKMLCEKLLEPFVLVLIILAIIAIVIGQWQEALVVFLIVIVDAILNTYQEVKATTSLNALKKLVSHKAIVIRDGHKHNIDAKTLVVGDLVFLEAGMFVPADLRVIQSYNLRTNESLLTGESTLVTKTVVPINQENLPLSSQTNIAFMSTMIVTGSGLGIVYATAVTSEIGKISKLLQAEKEPESPLIKQMTLLIRLISILALILGVVMFLVQFLISQNDIVPSLIFAIALIIAVIPEGLKTIVTVALALGSARMAKKHAIVKRLPAVETLGKVNIICCDKTGTLTQNKMTVQKYYLTKTVQPAAKFKITNQQTQLFLDCLILCNNSTFSKNKVIGDPTEGALISWAKSLKYHWRTSRSQFKRLHELPFDSERKLMTTINQYHQQTVVFVKGAIDNMIDLCTHVLINNEKVKLTATHKKVIIEQMETMSAAALRVLGASFKIINQDFDDFNDVQKVESDLTFLGLVAMIDPPRAEVKGALTKTRTAGIETIMITGDHLNTAVAIGQELGLITTRAQAISGEQLDQLSLNTLKTNINQYRVFARVSPEHKVKIVKAWQSHDKIVSMTGDGVNDAPSLKASNIGVAMGITGTDVAKEAAQIVLTDDNFSTIVDAIEEGRNIYHKIKRIICFILITNTAQVLAIILGAILQWNELLQPIQILWINLIVESIIAIPMAMGPNNAALMQEKPLKRNDRIISGTWGFIMATSFILSILLILVFRFLPAVLNSQVGDGYIFVFIIMANAPIFYAFSFGSGMKTSLFSKLTLKNKYIWIAALVAFIINAMIIFVPGINSAFSITADFRFINWLVCISCALIPMLLLEAYKGLSMLILSAKKIKSNDINNKKLNKAN